MTHSNCPDEETLAAYFDGLLAPSEEARVHKQILGCPECQTLMAALGIIVSAGDDETVPFTVPASVTAQAESLWRESIPEQLSDGIRLAIRWVGESLQPLADAVQPLNYASVPMRGFPAQGASEELMFEIQLDEVALHVNVETDGPSEIAITVKPISSLRGPLTLRVTQDDEVCAVSSLGPSGTTVSALPSGQYRLSVLRGEDTLGAFRLDLT